MNKILVVYYSRSGNTGRVAREIAAELDADCEAIVDHAERRGLRGYRRCTYEAWFGRPAQIDRPVNPIAGYDLVIVGTPIWCLSLSSPVRAFLRLHRGDIDDVAFFCTMGGSGARRVFRQMALEVGKDPRAVLALEEKRIATEAGRRAVRDFTTEIARDVALRSEHGPRDLTVAAAPAH